MLSDLWRKQKHEKKLAHNLKMSIARAEKRLLNPLDIFELFII